MSMSTDQDDDHDGRRRFRISWQFSIEGMIALCSSAAMIIYAFAFQAADIKQNARDIQSTKEWIDRHTNEDRQGSVQLDERLRHIEEKLDTLIGEENVRKRGS